MSFISNALAEATTTAAKTGGEPSALANLLPLALIFAVFYVFLIRPQQKKMKEHSDLINSVKRGDEIITGGGILGKVKNIEEGSNIISVEIADGVVVRINKATIVEVIKEPVK